MPVTENEFSNRYLILTLNYYMQTDIHRSAKFYTKNGNIHTSARISYIAQTEVVQKKSPGSFDHQIKQGK